MAILAKNNYQGILDSIVCTILEQNMLDKDSLNEANFSQLIQVREYQILIANDWNLDVKTGYDFLKCVLKLSN